MLAFPNAKINLGLYVTGKRPDGFHSLESIFYPIPLCDVIEVVEASSFTFQSGGLPVDGPAEHNLCIKAYQLLQSKYVLPAVNMYLLKNIPMGAGMGGGSADASFVLKLLNTLFSLNIKAEELEEYAARLGSDCPFFIRNHPAYVTGRGEVLEPVQLSLQGWHISLIHPNLHIGTKEAYAHIRPQPISFSLKEGIQRPVSEWKDFLKNDFEAFAFQRFPEIQALVDSFYNAGAAYSAMTGSGSAVFALSEQPLDMSGFKKDYFSWQGIL